MRSELRVTRLVVSMCGNLPDRHAVGAAARLARQLGAGLSGLLFEDDALATIRDLPFAREFAPASNKWLNLDKDHHAVQGMHARRLAQSLLEEAAAREGLSCSLDCDTGLLRCPDTSESEIFALVPPKRAGEATMLPFSSLVASVMNLEVHALIIPPLGIRVGSPIMAIADSAEDVSVDVAQSLAKSSESELTVLAKVGCFATVTQRFSNSSTRVTPVQGVEIEELEKPIAGMKPSIIVIDRPSAMHIGTAFWLRLATRDGIATLFLAE